MTCDEAEILLHALIDGELDAGHAREVEAHVASCPRCTERLAAYRQMSAMVARADLTFTAPAQLRRPGDLQPAWQHGFEAAAHAPEGAERRLVPARPPDTESESEIRCHETHAPQPEHS